MKLIVDSNIVFSALLNPSSNIGDIILNSQEHFIFYGCEYLRMEIAEHQDKIIELSGYTDLEFEEIKYLVFKKIEFFSESTVPFEFWKKAAELVRDIDANDTVFVALGLFFEQKIWTGDKKLMEGLIKKGYQGFITTQELLAIRKS